MRLVETFRSWLAARRAASARRRSIAIVNALPSDIQKDIGWPGFPPDGSRNGME